MADEKILKDKGLKDELLSDEQLEQVAGGKHMITYEQYQNTANTESIFTGNQKATDWLKDTNIW